MNLFSTWIYAARPRTLAAAAAPVFIGGAIAWKNGLFDGVSTAVALVCALLIQIGTNYANDYYDFRKGADTAERLGFKRAVASGWVSPGSMKRATFLVMGLAFLCGMLLVYKSGWPVFWLGLASILAGIAYTGGPFPLGYNGLGDVFVMLFFGQAAVMGTVFVNTGVWSYEAFIWSLGPGALAVNILVLNNLRDIETDRKAGKRTLGVFFGETALKLEYALMLTLTAAVPALLYGFSRPGLLAVSGLTLGNGAALLHQIMRTTDKRALNPLLEKTARLLALYGAGMTAMLVLDA